MPELFCADKSSFCGNVVFHSINMAFGDEDSILDQINEEKTIPFCHDSKS